MLERWNSGVHEARVLYEEVKAQGYEHSYNLVAGFIRCIKRVALETEDSKLGSLDSPHLPLTARRATWLVLGHAGEQDEDSKRFLECLKQHCSIFTEVISIAKDFAYMLRERKSEDFDDWLKRAAGCNLPALASFAKGIEEDYDAVQAGLTLPWSNGQVEGQINRLKMLKRQMYGRAGINLLEKRFILAG